MAMSRGEFLKRSAAVAAGAALLGSGLGKARADGTEPFVSNGSGALGGNFAVDPEWERDNQELISTFVGPCHFSIEQANEALKKDKRLVNARNYTTDEAGIEAAAHVGQPHIAQWLMGHGAPYTLHIAVIMGHLPAMRSFFEDDASQAARPGAHGIPMVYHGAISGSIETMELIEEFNPGDKPYDWALCASALHKHTEVTEWLLARTDNANHIHGTKTPLDFALMRKDNEAIVNMLKSAGGVIYADLPEEQQIPSY